MDTNHRHFPPEIAELIIGFASDPSPQTANRNPGRKHILLACALVCKTWLWPARRRLLSLDFRLGIVKVPLHTLLTLFDIFHSPLCTLDSGFIQVLEIAAGPGSKAETTFSFFGLLSTLDRISLPSLHTLRFRDVSPSFSKDEDDGSSSGSPASMVFSQSTIHSEFTILSQIKNLAFESTDENPFGFENVVYATRLFPFLETLTARGTSQHHNEVVYSFRPPQLLRKLDVDRPAFLQMAEWLTSLEPKHTGISSLSLYDPTSDYKVQNVVDCLSLAVSALGPGLEEFELNLLSVHYFHEHIFLFTNNTSLKRFLIRGGLSLLVVFIPYIDLIIRSLPRLETLEMFIEPWDEKLFSLLKVFALLDGYVESHSSLQRVVFIREHVVEDRGWGAFKTDMRGYMSRCVEKDIIKFRKNPWEDDD